MTVFDTAQQHFSGSILLLLPAAAVLVTLFLLYRRSSRGMIWMAGIFAVALFLLTFVLPLADHRHVEAMVASGAVKTVEGRISGHKRETYKIFTGTSRGVGVTTSHNYTNVTQEQFLVGQEWFWFRVNGMASQASFTNGDDPPVPLTNGSWARVRYFEDPWYDDERRIVKLEIREPKGVEKGMAATSGKPVPDAGFAAFWQGFSAAVGRGDEQAVRAATRFPFLFAGTPLDAGRFGPVWQALFTPPPLKECLAKAMPTPDGKGRSAFCNAYVYVFEKGADGWRFTGFTADPEAQ